MNLFLKYKIILLRSLGAVMLIVGLAIYFWVTPKEGVSANDKAAARIARMEATTQGNNLSSTAKKQETSKFADVLKEKQKEQLEYMLILVMLGGLGFLVYSFIQKKD